ncbi:MAG: GNAT family N-acetyltransferase [Isosphaeraceae bacterium]
MEVHPDHRRKGYGRFLLGEIFKRAREEGTAAVAVQTRSVNTAAIGLYAATGFAPSSRQPCFAEPAPLSVGNDGKAPLARSPSGDLILIQQPRWTTRRSHSAGHPAPTVWGPDPGDFRPKPRSRRDDSWDDDPSTDWNCGPPPRRPRPSA